jgi:surface protein with Ig-like domain
VAKRVGVAVTAPEVAPTGTIGPYAAGCKLTVGDACGGETDPQSFLICRHFCPNFPGLSPPTITLVGANPLVVECASGAYVDPGASAADDCGGDLTAVISTASSVDTAAPGAYPVAYEVTDSTGVNGTASRTVDVVDTTAPTVTPARPLVLWPPDHKLHAFTLADCASASDACAGALDLDTAGVITSVSPGVVVTGPSSFAVPAGRPGGSDGRLAEIGYTVSDPSGNATAATCQVFTPHDRSPAP